MRARLDERLKEFSSYLRTQQFDKYYDLFSASYIEELKAFNHDTKDEYLEHGKGLTKSVPPFDDFIPRSAAKTANDAYLISGEIRYGHNNEGVYNNASVEARWEKGDWYFSEFRRER
jgi:hypothetical protein